MKLDPKLELWGQWDLDNMTITLGRLVVEDPSQLVATLRHELRHAAIDLSGVTHGMTAKMQEQIVRCMENIADPALEEALDKMKYIGTERVQPDGCPCCGEHFPKSHR